MMWFFAILLVLLMGGVALVAAGRGAPLAEAYDDRPDALVPADGDLVPHDLRRVRFSLAFRGYRMSEVDALLDRLAVQLAPDPAAPDQTAPDQTAPDHAAPDHAAPDHDAEADDEPVPAPGSGPAASDEPPDRITPAR